MYENSLELSFVTFYQSWMFRKDPLALPHFVYRTHYFNSNVVQTPTGYRMMAWCINSVYAQLCSRMWLHESRHQSSGLWTHGVKFLKPRHSQSITSSSYESSRVCSTSLVFFLKGEGIRKTILQHIFHWDTLKGLQWHHWFALDCVTIQWITMKNTP